MVKVVNLCADAKIEAKIKQVENIFIVPPRIKEVLEKIDKCRRRSKLSKEPYCMLILGHQGVGKTTTYEYYEQQWPRVETPDGLKVPVLSVVIQVPATVKSLVTEMLRVLGDPAADKGTTVSQTSRLRSMLTQCEVELIILDEFQHFIDRDSQRVLRTISEWLKVQINTTRVPVVLCGMPYSRHVLDAMGNEQLRDRFSARVPIEPYGWGTQEDQREFRTFLAEVGDALPLRSCNLGSKEMAYRLYCASNGFVRPLMNLVRSAAITAIEQGNDSLEMDLLAEAFEERYAEEYPERKNPFSSETDELEIVPFLNSEPALRNLKDVLRKETASEVVRLH